MSNKKSNKRFLIGIAVAFLLPLSFYVYYTIRVGNAIKGRLPDHYGVVRVDNNTDTVFRRVADLRLVNQLGETVSLNKDLAGKSIVVNFMFTTCPTICPQLTANMLLLQRAFKKNDTTVHLVSITVDPERDSFPALREYADRYKVNHDHWWFLTGDKAAIFNFAKNELNLTSGTGDGGVEDLAHSQTLVLLDKDRYIRGYYNGLDSGELKQCADDVVLLTLEKKRKLKK